MAMNYAWQERKKFAIPLAVGIVAVLIWYYFILSGINGATDRDLANRKSAELMLRSRMQSGVPTDVAVGQADRDRGTIQEDLKDIQDKLAFRADESFRAKGGQSPAAKFGQQRQAVFSKLDAAVSSRGMDKLPNLLKFPQAFNDIPEPVLTEWLVRLAIVQRVVMVAIESGVNGITLLEVVPSEHQDEVTVPADRFLGVLAIKIKVTGSANSIISMVHGLQQEGPNFLALEAGAITSSAATSNLLVAELTVGGLVVRPEGAMIAEVKQ
jgi:hypothetical protein